MTRRTSNSNFRKRSVPFALIACLYVGGLRGAEDNAGQTADGPKAPPAPKALARQILDATDVQGGLIVHLGCGDGRLTAALRADDRYLVHGLDANAENVAAAREYLRSLGLYGEVSVERWAGAGLPYDDDLVNLLVVEQPDAVPAEELTRVLCPGGVAYLKRGGKWTVLGKPWPEEIGPWTHFLHDASNNAVAQDTRVGPPRRLKWICGPLWARSHEFTSSLVAMVSDGGRVFYIFDEGLTGVTPAFLPERWTLIARDAFNGVLLWKRRIENWGSGGWKNRALRSIPAGIPRRLVAQGDRLFITLGYDAPVSILDAASGEVLQTLEGTNDTEEIRCCDGVLLVSQSGNAILAFDSRTGKRLWKAEGNARPTTLAAQDGKLFYQEGQTLVGRGLTDGQTLWQVPAKGQVSLLLVHDGRVLLLSGPTLQALSAATGETLWTADAGVSRRELFVANDRIWHWQGAGFVGRNPQDGTVTGQIDPSEVFTRGHHTRCYQSKATENFLITPERGVEFVSVTGGRHTQCDWTRGPCRFGIMPCNGLLYVPPNPCFCYPGVKITGFNALAPQRDEGRGARGERRGVRDEGLGTRAERGEKREESEGKREEGGVAARLVRGPAYGAFTPDPSPLAPNPSPLTPHASPLVPHSSDWPTYRHDARRSGTTACEVPSQVATRWKVNLPGRLTPPVVCEGRLYVAAKDEHTLYALAVEDGRECWHFTADGRIDSPPTVCGQLVLFGGTDGRVYCLRASDGQLVWRFRAAPSDRRIVAFGQLESAWRVHGSILVVEGVAYFTAGRSTYLDGGIRIFALDPATGKVLHQTCLDTWARTRVDAEGKPFVPGYHMEGGCSDILVSQDGSIYLGQYKFDRTLAQQEVPYVMPGPDEKTTTMDLSNRPFIVPDQDPKANYEKHQRDWLERTQKGLLEELHRAYGAHSLGDRHMGLHVLTTSGFLDDSWYNRTYWMYSATWPGYYLAHRGAKTGHLLVVGPEKTYAVQAYPSRNLQSPLFTPATTGYLLFADRNDNEPVLDDVTRGTTKGWGFTRQQPPEWFRWVPVRIRGMVLAGKHLFVAGEPDVVDPDDPMAAFEGRRGAVLRAQAAADGETLTELKLDAPPVFDGLIAAAGRLFMCTTDGQVICVGGE